MTGFIAGSSTCINEIPFFDRLRPFVKEDLGGETRSLILDDEITLLYEGIGTKTLDKCW